MFGCTIAVVAALRQTKRQIARALRASASEAVFLEPDGVVQSLTSGKSPDLLIIDCEAGEADVLAGELRQLAANGRRIPVVILALPGDRTVTDLLDTYQVDNLIAKHGAIRAAQPMLDERELFVTCEKVLRRDIFGIEKYIGAWAIALQRETIRSSDSTRPALARLEQFLDGLDCPARIAPQVVTVAEELIINAIVHAPRDGNGAPKYEHLHPRTPIELEPREHVELVYGCDGQRLMLSVADNFGQLDRRTVTEYLARGFSTGDVPLDGKPSGAGLGLSLSWANIHQLVFNVQEDVRTEVIAGWYIGGHSVGEFRRVGKSLNVFWLPAGYRPLCTCVDNVASSVPT